MLEEYINKNISLEHKLLSQNTAQIQNSKQEEEMRMEHENLMRRVSDQEIQMRQTNELVDVEKRKNQQLINDLKSIEGQMAAQQFEMQQAQKQRDQMEAAATNFKEEVVKLNITIRKGMLENDNYRHRNQELEKNLELAKMSYKDLKTENDALKQKCSDLNYERVALQKNTKIMETDFEKIGNQIMIAQGHLHQEDDSSKEIGTQILDKLVVHMKSHQPFMFAGSHISPNLELAGIQPKRPLYQSQEAPAQPKQEEESSPEKVKAEPARSSYTSSNFATQEMLRQNTSSIFSNSMDKSVESAGRRSGQHQSEMPAAGTRRRERETKFGSPYHSPRAPQQQQKKQEKPETEVPVQQRYRHQLADQADQPTKSGDPAWTQSAWYS